MTISLIQVLLDFVDRAHTHATYEGLRDDFNQTMKRLGFDHFMMARLPTLERITKKHVVANTWPSQWFERYYLKAYYDVDPITSWSRQSTRPFTWKEARSKFAETQITAQIESEAALMGFVDGIAFQLGDIHCTRSVFSVASDRAIDIPLSLWPLIHLAAQQFQQKAVEIWGETDRTIAPLSARERDVLTWAAVGKSNWETSVILGISEKTVEAMLAQVRRKLNVSNTVHAVTAALLSGQIKL